MQLIRILTLTSFGLASIGALSPASAAEPDEPRAGLPSPAAPTTAPAAPLAPSATMVPCPKCTPCPASAAEIDAESYYREAMQQFSAKRHRRARELLQLVVTRHPTSSYASAAKSKLIELDSSHDPGAEPRGRDTTGRTELIIGNALLWSGLGSLFPLLGGGEDAAGNAMLWSALGTGVGAGVGSYFLTRNVAISDGYAHLHHFAQIWGAWSGLAIHMLADPHFDDANARSISGSVLGGAAAGLLTSIVFKDGFSIPRGEAEFISSVASWGSIAGASLSILLWGKDIEVRPVIGTVVASGNGALLASLFFRPRWTKSRLRYINLLAFGGVLLGDAILASARSNDPRFYGGVSLGALAAGIAVGILVTSGMAPAGASNSEASISPNALVTLVDGKLDWGVPLPRIAPRPVGRELAMGIEFDLLAGRF